MTTPFPTISHKDLKRTVIDTLAADSYLQETVDMVSFGALNIAELDGAFVLNMVDAPETDVDYAWGDDQRGGIQTKGRMLITILTPKQDPGVVGNIGGVTNTMDKADGKIQRAIKVLFKKFRPVASDEPGVSGVTDIRYAGARSAYPFRGSTDWYAVDVSFDFYFTVSQDAE